MLAIVALCCAGHASACQQSCPEWFTGWAFIQLKALCIGCTPEWLQAWALPGDPALAAPEGPDGLLLPARAGLMTVTGTLNSAPLHGAVLSEAEISAKCSPSGRLLQSTCRPCMALSTCIKSDWLNSCS